MGSLNSFLVRRVLAVDAGQRRIKVLFAESRGDRVEVLHALTIDLHEEGLLTQEEAGRHISRILGDLGDYPISVVAPQHVAISHLISLPTGVRTRWRRLVEEEAQKLTGLSEAALVYGYQKLRPLPSDPNPLWVSVSREIDLRNLLARLGDAGEQVAEIVNTSSALASAFAVSSARNGRIALVEIGAGSTAVVAMEEGQPVYTTNFPIGGDHFTDRLAAELGIGVDEAESLKKTAPLLAGAESVAAMKEAVGEWRAEVEKSLLDWAREQGPTVVPPHRIYVAGGPAGAPGFFEFLNAESPFSFRDWKEILPETDAQTYAAAYGAALAGLGRAAVAPSLLPKPIQTRQRRIRQTVLINLAAVVMVLATLVALVTDTMHRQRAVDEKERRLADRQEAFALAGRVEGLLERRAAEFNTIVPAVQRQQLTRDLLSTLFLMQEVRTEYDLWFVSFSDRNSYVQRRVAAGRIESGVDATGIRREERRNGRVSPREVPPASPASPDAFVVELAILDEGRDTHIVLRNVVETFDSRGIFRNVDIIPGLERTELVDSRLTLPGRTFALNLDLMPTQSQMAPVGESKEQ